MKLRASLAICCLTFVLVTPLMATLGVNLTPSVPSPQPLGTSVGWTATVFGDPDPNPVYEYQFTAQPTGTAAQVRLGYSHNSAFTFTPSTFEGTFTVGVTVKNVHAGTSASNSASYVYTSRQSGDGSAVNATNNPLVALFSTRACQVPNLMRVRFTPTSVPAGGNASAVTTNLVPCRYAASSKNPDKTSMNFYVGGMYPSTTYNMHYEVVNPAGQLVNKGSDYPFTAGAIPSSLHFPQFYPTGTSADQAEQLVLHSVVTIPVNGHIYTSAAVDLAGNIVWYSAVPPVRTEIGGNQFGFVPNADPYKAGIVESDLAGNTVVQTTVGAVNEQLAARGARPITAMHHEVRRITTPSGNLPNGYILTIGSTEQVCTSCQGGTPTNPVDVIGDELIVMDPNMNVVWTWDAFNYLDINQVAILGETCMHNAGGCEPFSPNFSVANDWLHSNSVQYNAWDGNIIFSTRHQDAVFKVNYGNGSGDGHIIWKLGNGPIGGPGATHLPSFSLSTVGTGGPDLGYPWFSHQHDAQFQLGGYLFGKFRVLMLFDDGNTRQAFFNPNADSRCQILAVDETDLVANLNTNGDVLSYSFALGSAQLLANGSLHCNSGFIGGFQNAMTNPLTQSVELDQKGNFIFQMNAAEVSYRTWRMKDLYTEPNP